MTLTCSFILRSCHFPPYLQCYLMHLERSTFFFFKIFFYGPFLNSLLRFYNIVSVFVFVFGHKADGILDSSPGIEPASPAMKSKVLTLDHPQSPSTFYHCAHRDCALLSGTHQPCVFLFLFLFCVFFFFHQIKCQFSSGQSLSHVPLFVTPWTAAHQASLSITNSQSLLKFMSTESVMPSNHLILCHPLLFLSSNFPSLRIFSNESVLQVRWPKYWSFSFSICPSNEYSGLISFLMDWFDLLAVQGTLKSLLQQHSSKASILWRSSLFMV